MISHIAPAVRVTVGVHDWQDIPVVVFDKADTVGVVAMGELLAQSTGRSFYTIIMVIIIYIYIYNCYRRNKILRLI